jgi:endogenous inhibitor of DNA gyrase (YacG/DUF329 family)
MTRLAKKKDPEKQEKRHCPHCDKLFVLTRKNKLFCSDTCRVKHFMHQKKLKTEIEINDLKEKLRKYEEAEAAKVEEVATPKIEEVPAVAAKPNRTRTRTSKSKAKEAQPGT